jgi:murein DD-endopeptidase MepM/ murein hydrolase activator NlpD
MKFGAPLTAGNAIRSASRAGLVALLAAGLLVSVIADAQSLYKYRGGDGEWMFSDRPPADARAVETRALPTEVASPTVAVEHRLLDDRIYLRASNTYYAPVELVLGIDELRSIEKPAPEQPLRFVLPVRGQTELMSLAVIADSADAPAIRYRYTWIVGDPTSTHSPETPYRAPFAVARSHPISQAFPTALTHSTADSRYAIDIVMPIGTGVYAARAGTVFQVASQNFRSGLDVVRDGPAANLVRILHSDGTYAEYAHLNWNTIRVRPGDAVRRGEYIADSGNTGFTSGPHLHFAVLRNRGMGTESVPVVFDGPNGSEQTPETGNTLSAY